VSSDESALAVRRPSVARARVRRGERENRGGRAPRWRAPGRGPRGRRRTGPRSPARGRRGAPPSAGLAGPPAGGMPGSLHHRRVRARAAAPSTRETSSTPRPPRASTSTEESRPSSKTGVPVGSEVARSAREARKEPARTAEARRARCAPGRHRSMRPPAARRAARQASPTGPGRTRAGIALPMPSARTGKTSGRVPRSFQLQSRIAPPPGRLNHHTRQVAGPNARRPPDRARRSSPTARRISSTVGPRSRAPDGDCDPPGGPTAPHSSGP
jgi:hypothetical protein